MITLGLCCFFNLAGARLNKQSLFTTYERGLPNEPGFLVFCHPKDL